jgi:hypothetical protein
MKIKLIVVLSFCCFYTNAQEKEFQALLNKKNLEGWNSYLLSKGVNSDPDSVFNVKEGCLEITGEEFGYIATKETFKNFHLVAEFKWGEKKYPPRENEKRDSGILYFVPIDAPEKIWPKSVECQIQEGDVGDFWLIDGTSIKINSERTPPQDYFRVEKVRDNEFPNGKWNSVEVISRDRELTHKVNGVVVNKGSAPSRAEGLILIQSEGAEIFYRNIEIKRL